MPLRRFHPLSRAWLLALVVLALQGIAGAAWAGQKVRVGLYQNPPKVDVTAGGGPQGIFVDLVEAIARKEDWDVQYVPGTFAEGLERLARGDIDLMPDVARTPGRNQLFAFHQDPVLHSWSQVYTRPGQGVRTILDLSGRRVAVLEASVQQDFFRQFADDFRVQATTVPFPEYAQAFAAVRDGRADAVVSNSLHGALRARNFGLEDTAIIFAPSGLFFAAPRKGSAPLLAAIDRRLAELQGDPRSAYYRSLQKWTPSPELPLFPPWAKWAVAAAVLLMAGGTAWALTLRRAAAKLRASESVQRELIARLESQALDLQRSNEDLRTFSHSVSHDLRGPLAAISGFVGKVLRDEAQALPSPARSLLERVVRATSRMESLIEDLLRLARVAEFEVRPAHVDVSAMAAEVAEALRGCEPHREVRVAIAPGMQATADPRLLRIALENLLANAWKFTAHTPEPEIRVGQEEHDGELAFLVADNGAGFDMQYAARLFQPFQRLHDAGEFQGTGIGLSIVQRVVAHHGGRIRAQAEPGQGARFWFTLAPPGPATSAKWRP